MTTRDAWPQAQALMSDTVYWEAGMQSSQHKLAGTASSISTKTYMQAGTNEIQGRGDGGEEKGETKGSVQ